MLNITDHFLTDLAVVKGWRGISERQRCERDAKVTVAILTKWISFIHLTKTNMIRKCSNDLYFSPRKDNDFLF